MIRQLETGKKAVHWEVGLPSPARRSLARSGNLPDGINSVAPLLEVPFVAANQFGVGIVDESHEATDQRNLNHTTDYLIPVRQEPLLRNTYGLTAIGDDPAPAGSSAEGIQPDSSNPTRR